jgi:hypothetical protein
MTKGLTGDLCRSSSDPKLSVTLMISEINAMQNFSFEDRIVHHEDAPIDNCFFVSDSTWQTFLQIACFD